MITKEIALRLSIGTELYHVCWTDEEGNRIRCRVNGKCKTWARKPDVWELPVRHGLMCFRVGPVSGRYWLTREQLADPQYMSLQAAMEVEYENSAKGVLMDYLKDRGDA